MLNSFFVFFLIILFLVLNFFSFKSFFYNYFGEKYFLEGNFEKSENFFGKTGENSGKINNGILHYKNKNFEKSKEIFESLDLKNNEEKFFVNDMLGNIFYKIGEKIESIEEKKVFLEKSLKKFDDALEIKFDEKVEEKRKFVEEKLKELETSPQNSLETSPHPSPSGEGENSDESSSQAPLLGEEGGEKEEPKKDSETSSEGQSNNSEGQKEDKQGNKENVGNDLKSSQKNEDSEKNGEKKSSEKDSEIKKSKGKENENVENEYIHSKSLNEEQKQEIQKYEAYLKENQKYFMGSFDKKYKQDDYFGGFWFNENFFGDFESGEKKDW